MMINAIQVPADRYSIENTANKFPSLTPEICNYTKVIWMAFYKFCVAMIPKVALKS